MTMPEAIDVSIDLTDHIEVDAGPHGARLTCSCCQAAQSVLGVQDIVFPATVTSVIEAESRFVDRHRGCRR